MMYDGWVYIAQSGTGHYKIGRSKNPFGRVKHFDTIMPVEVEIVALIPCDDYVAAEKRLHEEYKEYRFKGEWFDIPDEEKDRLHCLICYMDGRFLERLDYGINKGKDNVANTCCVDYQLGLENGGVSYLWHEVEKLTDAAVEGRKHLGHGYSIGFGE